MAKGKENKSQKQTHYEVEYGSDSIFVALYMFQYIDRCLGERAVPDTVRTASPWGGYLQKAPTLFCVG